MKTQILNTLKSNKKPMGKVAIMKSLNLPRHERSQFNRELNKLVSEGAVQVRKGRYRLDRRLDLIPAEIVTVAGTFGFAQPENTDGDKDIFIPGRYLLGGMPGDHVLIRLSSSQKGELREGSVFQITKEVNKPFAGIIEKGQRGDYFIQPDSLLKFPLMLDPSSPKIGKPGDKVLAQVKHRGERHSRHTVEILQVFGSAESAYNSSLAIMAENYIQIDFESDALEQAKALSSGLEIHPSELEVRVDLRGENIFTIDGADTKDIDDAISLEPTKDGWELGVHIADVSYYVTRNSPLDKSSYNRGTSVYYADQVIPMLPKELSNGICSLNPDEDRLAFSCIMQLDNSGVIKSYRFEKTVINSRIQGVYSEINQILAGDASKDILDKYKDQLEVIKNMEKLAKVLKENRYNRNSINLHSVERKIIVDGDGKAVDIVPRTQGLSENIIEEFMLVTNECAAKFAIREQLPFIYRVHENPDPERLENLYNLLEKLGIPYNRPQQGQSPAHMLQSVLAKVKDTPMEGIVNYSILRTMAKAKYSSENLGHFGLGLNNYAHFTAPIRRYPDLSIHRILTGRLTGMRKDNIEKHFRDWVDTSANHSSTKEMDALTASRDAEDCYMAEYMKSHIGKEFTGIISSVTGFGIFVQLPNTVEGLIHTDNFPKGNWFYDDVITYSNQVGGATLTLGDSVDIVVADTNVAKGTIDFGFAKPELYTK